MIHQYEDIRFSILQYEDNITIEMKFKYDQILYRTILVSCVPQVLKCDKAESEQAVFNLS